MSDASHTSAQIPAHVSAAIDRIRECLGERISVSDAVRDHHGHDESWFETAPPDAVCFVRSAEEISRVLVICNELKVPVIPFGAGSGVAGQVNAIRGGICVDLSGMNDILAVHPEDFDCVVQAGVTRNQLNQHLRETGLFFSVDPGADATLGGMAATRASGTNAVRYGTMRENVVALKAVLPDGSIIETGGRSRKSAAGYDLAHLFVGSEGTFGIIVELTLRLHGLPAASSAASVQFRGLHDAVEAVIETLRHNIPVARIELVDETLIRAMNEYSKTDFPVCPSLFVEFHGSENSVRENAELFGEICRSHGCAGFRWTANSEEQNRMWRARHDAAWAFMALRPNTRNISTDVCVPISRLADCLRDTTADIEQSLTLVTTIAGHVGDGNFHVVFLVDPSIASEKAEVEAFYARLVDRALDMGGTCTGEHGVGIQKLQYLDKEFGQPTMKLMRTIKSAIDPHNIMNPGKKITMLPVS